MAAYLSLITGVLRIAHDALGKAPSGMKLTHKAARCHLGEMQTVIAILNLKHQTPSHSNPEPVGPYWE